MTGLEFVVVIALVAVVTRRRRPRRRRSRISKVGGVVAVAWERRHRRSAAPAELCELSPAEFEHYVGRWLEAKGYCHVRVLGGPGDLGADIICTDPRRRRIIVQCKRYGRTKVSSGEIQLLIGAKAIHRAELAIMATTSELTEPAQRLARTHGVMVSDWQALGLASEPTPR